VRPGPGRQRFDPEQVRLLEAFASQIALAVERTNLAAEAQAAELEAEAERMRSSLLSSVSHDLRTPLAALTGASSTLLRAGEGLPGIARTELLASIHEEAQRLDRFVGNLLDMTRLEAGAIKARKEWQPVDVVIGAALARLDDRLVGREVRTQVPESLPLVPLDTALVEQALINLLENVLNHTPVGSPIEVVARAEHGGVVIEVADRGAGLPAGEEDRVFDKFYRGPGAGSEGGAGLGLAICRAITAVHGGSVRAANRPGGGAIFSLWLPIEGEPPSVEAEAGGDRAW